MPKAIIYKTLKKQVGLQESCDISFFLFSRKPEEKTQINAFTGA